MSVNMNRQSALTHSLLQTSTADILMIQELWIGTVQIGRSDSDPLGQAITGATNNNMWECFLPSFTDPSSVRVAAYVKTDFARTFAITNVLSHPISSPESMILDISFDQELLRIVNVYHRTPADRDGHNLLHILSSTLDPLIPTLLLGDFNTHSHLWSFPYSTISPWAAELVDWFDDQGLELLHPPHTATWRSHQDRIQPSVLDLALINKAAAISGQISPISISFVDSVSSDHAALSLFWYPAEAIAIAPPPELTGYQVDPDFFEEWSKFFVALLPEPTPLTSIESLRAASVSLHEDIDAASASVLKRCKYPDPRGVHWWNRDCNVALTAVYSQNLHGPACKTAIRTLRNVIAQSKRQWAHDFLHHTTSENLWEATAWRKGRSIKCIPPLLTSHGALSHNPVLMSAALQQRFFVTDRPQVAPLQPDDPPPLPPRDFTPITEEEITAAIAPTSNKSTPGSSGIGYALLKWAFQARPDRFVTIFNASISLGYHPWKDALVVIVPKPHKPNYSLPKAYRPISLLECCGKLLEKIIARRILSDAHTYDILPNSQFGSRDYHCATDAALCLVHHAQAAVKCHFVASVILFDISGFFNNINIERITQIFRNLGFTPSLCTWVQSFLSDRQVRLSFNGFKSDPIALDHGSPQGSPLSPILSALFTSPLLKLINSTWKRRGLNMYVDDGAIFSCGVTHIHSANLAREGFSEITRWLAQNGLKADPEKSEFISFAPNLSQDCIGGTVTDIRLSDTFGDYGVRRSDVVRYLGIFIHHKFQWKHHVTIMANHARSTICALSILGNSVRGLDFANWRRVFHSLILPILTYGFPLYSSQSRIKGILDILQIAQNDAVRKISGCFKTTPIIPLHFLIAIPPIKHTIKKLTSQFKIRVANLPPTHLLRTITTFNPAADWHLSTNPETALTRLLPLHAPFFTFPSHPSQSKWVHPQVRDKTVLINPETKEYTRSLIQLPTHNSYSIFIRVLTTPSPPFAAGFIVRKGGSIVHNGTSLAPTRIGALLQALLQGLTYASFSNEIQIFLPDRSLSESLFNTSKHPFLFLSCALIDQMILFLSAHPLHYITFHRYSVKWAGLPGKTVFQDLTEKAQQAIFPLPPHLLLRPKDILIRDLQEEYIQTIRAGHIWQLITLPDGRPPPFTLGALSRKDRRTFTSALQLASRHAFHKWYSDHFRRNAGDNNICPCSDPDLTPPSPSGSLRSDTSGYNRLMAEYLAAHSPPPSPCDNLPCHQCQQPRLRRQTFHNSIPHVLFVCPLLTSPCRHIFGPQPSEEFIFGTFEGGAQLGAFQRATNRLLRPLPPRPDPP